MVLLMCVANLILDFSPLREVRSPPLPLAKLILSASKTLIEKGVLEKVVEFIDEGADTTITLNAVWIFRSALYRAAIDVHKVVWPKMGMNRLERYA